MNEQMAISHQPVAPCAKCGRHNTTLHWHETAKGFQCPGCYYGRTKEQQRLDQQWQRLWTPKVCCRKKFFYGP